MAKRSFHAEGATDGLLEPPHDAYWDAPITRREVQEAVNQLSENDRVLSLQNDTSNLVLNYLCEKANIKREELDAWVAEKQKLIVMVKAGILKPDASGELKAVTPPESPAIQEENVTQPES